MTDAFRAAWGNVAARKPVALARLETQAGAAFYFSTTPTFLNGVQYEPVLGAGSIGTSTQFMATALSLATCNFSLAEKPLSIGVTTKQLFSQHQFIGATVTVWLWEESLTDPADVFQRFYGAVQSYSVGRTAISLECVQSRRFNQSIVARTVSKTEFPQAPDEMFGVALPTYYGDMRAIGMRFPWTARFGPISDGVTASPQYLHEQIVGGKHVGKAVLVDTGRGTANAKGIVYVSGHKLKNIGNCAPDYAGCGVFMEQDGILLPLDLPRTDFFNTDSGAGFYLRDSAPIGVYPMFPKTVIPVDKTSPYAPLNANLLSDENNEYVPVRVYLDQPNSWIRADITPVSVPGTVTGLKVVIGWRPTNPAGVNYRDNFISVQLFGPDGLMKWSTADLSPIGANPDIHWATIPIGTNGIPESPADFTGWYWRIGGADYDYNTQYWSSDVFFFGMAALFVPDQKLIEVSKSSTLVPVPVRATDFISGTSESVINTYAQKAVQTNLVEFTGKFFANAQGWADDAVGTYTGTPSALIERIPDVTRHMMEVYGEVPAESIELGSGLGSFIAARDLFKNEIGVEMKLAFSFSQEIQLSNILSWIMASSLSDVWMSSYDGVWRILPWATTTARSYPRLIESKHVLDPENGVRVSLTADSDVVSAANIHYAFEESGNKYLSTVSASATTSSSGSEYHNLRDGAFTVSDNENKYFDFAVTPNAYPTTVMLDNGTYTREGIAGEVHSKLNKYNDLPYQTYVITSQNNALPIKRWDGTSIVWAYIQPGTYTLAQFTTKLNLALGAARLGTGEYLKAGVLSQTKPGGWLFTSWSDTYDYGPPFYILGQNIPQGSNLGLLLGIEPKQYASTGVYERGGQPTWPLLYCEQPLGPWSVAFNGEVVAGINDVISYMSGSTNTIKKATIPAGVYSYTELAAAAEAALNVNNPYPFVVRYSFDPHTQIGTTPPRYYFRFTRPAYDGALTPTWRFAWDADAASAATHFGFGNHSAGTIVPQGSNATIVSEYPIGTPLAFSASRFRQSVGGQYDTWRVLWRTGPHGPLGSKNSVANLIGADISADDGGVANISDFRILATAPKHSTEALFGEADTVYGKKVPVQIDARCVSDTDTAIELRNRVAALGGKTRGNVSFTTTCATDLERGDTFSFDQSLDELCPYPVYGTTGVLSDRVFRVVEERQQFGDAWYSEYLATDVTD